MRFGDIKIGDKVFVRREVRYGFHEFKYFYVQVEVDRVTKTQFTADGRRFKKDFGRQIGGNYGQSAFTEGSTDEIYDQAEEMELFITRVKMWQETRQTIEDISISLDNPNLTEIHNLAAQVSRLCEQND